MISILRPSTPPLALISSAASCAAGAMDEPATACASEMTPILMGSAANAWLAETMAPQATTAATFDNAPTCRNLRLMKPPFVGFIVLHTNRAEARRRRLTWPTATGSQCPAREESTRVPGSQCQGSTARLARYHLPIRQVRLRLLHPTNGALGKCLCSYGHQATLSRTGSLARRSERTRRSRSRSDNGRIMPLR